MISWGIRAGATAVVLALAVAGCAGDGGAAGEQSQTPPTTEAPSATPDVDVTEAAVDAGVTDADVLWAGIQVVCSDDYSDEAAAIGVAQWDALETQGWSSMYGFDAPEIGDRSCRYPMWSDYDETGIGSWGQPLTYMITHEAGLPAGGVPSEVAAAECVFLPGAEGWAHMECAIDGGTLKVSWQFYLGEFIGDTNRPDPHQYNTVMSIITDAFITSTLAAGERVPSGGDDAAPASVEVSVPLATLEGAALEDALANIGNPGDWELAPADVMELAAAELAEADIAMLESETWYIPQFATVMTRYGEWAVLQDGAPGYGEVNPDLEVSDHAQIAAGVWSKNDPGDAFWDDRWMRTCHTPMMMRTGDGRWAMLTEHWNGDTRSSTYTVEVADAAAADTFTMFEMCQ